MLFRLLTLMLISVDLITCPQKQVKSGEGISDKRFSLFVNKLRQKRDRVGGDSYIWSDDNGLYTFSPPLDTDIVYGKVEKVPVDIGVQAIKTKYVKPYARQMNVHHIDESGTNYQLHHAENINGQKKTVFVKQDPGGDTYVKKIESVVRPESYYVARTNNGDKSVKLIETKLKPGIKQFSLQGGRKGKPYMLSVHDSPPQKQKTITVYNRDRNTGKFHQKVVSFREPKHHVLNRVHHLVSYKKNSIDNDISQGEIETYMLPGQVRHQVFLQHNEDTVHKPLVVKTTKHLIHVPVKYRAKIDNSVLLENGLSRHYEDINKKVLNQKFLNTLYNFYSAQQALQNKKTVHLIHPLVWSDWSNWGPCSVTCDYGIQYRSRTCLLHTIPKTCQGSGSLSRPCLTRICKNTGEWLAWSRWSSCSATCGYSWRHRTRVCKHRFISTHAYDCKGTGTQKEICHLQFCSKEKVIHGNVVYATEGDIATLTCKYDKAIRPRSVHWITPARETITKGTKNDRYTINGDSLVIHHTDKSDIGLYKCVIITESHGKVVARASMLVEDCNRRPCHNGGVCVEQKSGKPPYSTFICRCATGYFGRRCSLGIGPAGIAALIVGIILSMLLIIVVVLICNHRNAKLIDSMKDDDIIPRKKNIRSNSFAGFAHRQPVTFKRRAHSDDMIARKVNAAAMSPSIDRLKDWKTSLENEKQSSDDDLYLVGGRDVLKLQKNDNARTAPTSNYVTKAKIKSILSDSRLGDHNFLKTKNVSFNSTQQELTEHECTNHRIISPPVRYATTL